jgi:hypothetical protein
MIGALAFIHVMGVVINQYSIIRHSFSFFGVGDTIWLLNVWMSTRIEIRALRRSYSISGERGATQLAKIAAGRSATKEFGCELEAQTSRGMHLSFKVVGDQRSFARPQWNQQRQSLDTADIGRKAQEASDGLTMSAHIAALAGKGRVSYESGTVFGETDCRRLTFR